MLRTLLDALGSGEITHSLLQGARQDSRSRLCQIEANPPEVDLKFRWDFNLNSSRYRRLLLQYYPLLPFRCQLIYISLPSIFPHARRFWILPPVTQHQLCTWDETFSSVTLECTYSTTLHAASHSRPLPWSNSQHQPPLSFFFSMKPGHLVYLLIVDTVLRTSRRVGRGSMISNPSSSSPPLISKCHVLWLHR